MTNTKTIARNTGWYGLENAISLIVGLVTSIAIARTLGPTKMGYIIYVVWIASIVSRLGGLGIPATTRKYMAEFLGGGDRGTARYIYIRTMFLQIGMATLVVGALIFWVLRDASADYRLASILIIVSVWPSMVNSISSQANVATEELSTNLPASVISTFVYFTAVIATVVFHWGVTGFGAAVALMASVDFLVRVFPTMKRILAWETTRVLPAGLSRRMMTFAWQSVTTMLVSLVVWDRSEFLLLKRLCPDIRQISYYSVAFNIAERLLLSSLIFGAATGATIFAQYGRDKSRLPELTASAFRYLALTSIPLHIIFVSLSVPALLLLYGSQYQGAATVVAMAPLLCMPKAFIAPVQSLLQSNERQLYVILATIFAGVVDIGVAWYFIPAYGAVGACLGNGAAQFTAAGVLWFIAFRLYKVNLPWILVAKVTVISVLASLAAHSVAAHLNPLWGLLCGGTAALIVLFGLFYLMGVLEPQDHDRFRILAGMLPKPFAGPVNAFLPLLIRREDDLAAPSIPDEAAPARDEAATRSEEQHRMEFQYLTPSNGVGWAEDEAAKISVVIPAYNAAAFLPRCLGSVFAQTMKPDEVIVVDDGSTDDTAALAAELGAKVIRRHPNGGISAARNTGILGARGEWIALLDADDLWEPEKLERQFALTGPDTVLVYTGIRVFDQNGIRDAVPASDPISTAKMLRYQNPITPSTVLLRRKAALQVRGFREDVLACEDWDMWVRLQRLGPFKSIADPLVKYYVYPASISADPGKMLVGLNQVIDTTLLTGLRGFDRWAWRRRIRAAQYCSAGLIARDNGLKDEISYILKSLREWPSPLWDSRRFAFLAVSLRNRFRSREEAL